MPVSTQGEVRMAEKQTVKITVKNLIARVQLNRPEALNAINWMLIRQMSTLMDTLKSENDVWVVYFEGLGKKAFSVGADLKERIGMPMTDILQLRGDITTLFRKITEFPKPTIAAVHGYALGGGFELSLACDIIIADETTVFGLTETSLGIIPGAGGTQALPKRIGISRAKELIFTAKRINAREAERLGIPNQVVPENEAGKTARDLAETIVANAPIAVRQAKRAIDNGAGKPPDESWTIEEEAYNMTLETRDRSEALAAFAEKRAP